MGGRLMNTITKVIDTLTGKSLKVAAEENAKTAADLKDAVKRATARIDAERAAEDAEARKAAK
jgi:hypothetical protein